MFRDSIEEVDCRLRARRGARAALVSWRARTFNAPNRTLEMHQRLWVTTQRSGEPFIKINARRGSSVFGRVLSPTYSLEGSWNCELIRGSSWAAFVDRRRVRLRSHLGQVFQELQNFVVRMREE